MSATPTHIPSWKINVECLVQVYDKAKEALSCAVVELKSAMFNWTFQSTEFCYRLVCMVWKTAFFFSQMCYNVFVNDRFQNSYNGFKKLKKKIRMNESGALQATWLKRAKALVFKSGCSFLVTSSISYRLVPKFDAF